MHNTGYAFDADTGAQLSARSLGTPITGFDLGVLKPVTTGNSSPTYRLFGLDMSDLSHARFGSVVIDGYKIGGKGFDRYRRIQRAGLALATKPGGAKALVIALGGGEGQGPRSGWVIAFAVFKLANGRRSRQCLVRFEQGLRRRRRRRRVDGQCRTGRG